MKMFNKVLLFLVLVLIFSCEKHGSFFIYCRDCTPDEPQKASLEIRLSDMVYDSVVEIKIYEGNLEDSILYDTKQAHSMTVNHWVMMNKKYTLTARYYKPGSTTIAVNSVTPRVKYDETQCDDPCYYVYDRVVDLRLK